MEKPAVMPVFDLITEKTIALDSTVNMTETTPVKSEAIVEPSEQYDDSINQPRALFYMNLVKFFEMSSLQGVPNIARSRSKLLRLFWLVAVLASFSISIRSVAVLLDNYNQYNVLIKFELQEKLAHMEFPAITLCNMNPFDFSNQSNVELFSQNLFKYKNDIRQYFGLNISSSYQDIEAQVCKSSLNLKGQSELIGRYFMLNQYSFPLQKMIISCFFEGKPCDMNNDFVEANARFFGRCFTFNPKGNRKVNRLGQWNGLQIELFVGEDEFQPCWESRRGYYMAMNSLNQKPVLSEETYPITPGLDTNVALKLVEYKKLSRPYSDCIEDIFTTKQNENREWVSRTISLDGSYSQKWCLKYCASDLTLKENARTCARRNDSSWMCLEDETKITEYYQPCFAECPMECNHRWFTTSVYSAEYPSTKAAQVFLKTPEYTSRFSNPKNLTVEKLKSSVLSLNVYFDSFLAEVYSEMPQTDFNTLMCNLGGQFGLWIGASVLSFLEIVDLVYLLCEFGFMMFKSKSQVVAIHKSAS